MALTQKQLQDECCLWQGSSQCRYLEQDVNAYGDIVYVCLKKSPQKKLIDEEVTEFLDDCKAKGTDPHTVHGVSLGDNCSGYIRLTTKMQGYDLP